MRRLHAALFTFLLAVPVPFPPGGRVLEDRGFEVVASSPEQFVRFVKAESDKLGMLIRDNAIVAE